MSGTIFSIISPTGQDIDAVLGGRKWGPLNGKEKVTVTYSFPGAISYWSTDPVEGYGSGGQGEPWNDLVSLPAATREAVVNILQMISSFTNLNFKQVQDSITVVGDLRFAFSSAVSPNAVAHAYGPGGSYSVLTKEGTAYAWAGDVWLNLDEYGNGKFSSVQAGDYYYLTLIHEIGHALGLKHTFEA